METDYSIMRIEDLRVDYSAKQRELDNYALKADRENVKAFIDGYNKNGRIIKNSIIVASKNSHSLSLGNFRKRPKLVIPNKNRSHFELSGFGKKLDLQDYVIEKKYIAILDTIFHINNRLEIWNVLCNDDTFDIWKSIAPYKFLKTTKNGLTVDRPDPSILLLRIFEIDQIIPDEKMTFSDRIVTVVGTNVVTIKRPILTDEEFFTLKIHLIRSLNGIENPGKISKDTFDEIQDLIQEQARKQSTEVLKNMAYQAPAKPEMKEVFSKQYERNPAVVELAKRRAKGKCQLCGESAPFNNKNNEPYLEVHHIKWLSDGGLDTITNTVALCPNCHRKMHVLNLQEDITILKNKT